MSKAATALKRVLVGSPRSTGEMEHTLLPKVIALPILSSDALSSSAYAVQEILLVLAAAGAGALALVTPVALAVAALLTIVVISYRQIARAYPQGGGAYVVTRQQFGLTPGLLVAAALMIDYMMTVAVSITSGVDAIVSAALVLAPFRVELVILLIVGVALANLRGVKESGRIFALPTYGFIAAVYATVIVGLFKCIGGCPEAPSAHLAVHAVEPLSIFLILRAFAAGTAALTGVEAITDSVPMFRYPQSRNAATTLGLLALFACTMFVGLSVLSHLTHVHYLSAAQRTAVAQVGLAVFGNSFGFFFLQAMTAGILILAANTAFNGFPVLMSILARDRVVPRYFMSRGDRLVLSNGIIILATAAALVVWAFRANLNSLIQLYLIGVFISFTLAQAGTVRKWKAERPPRWKRRAVINSIGSAMTGIVLVVVLITKFRYGAWIVVVLIPLLIWLMHSMHRHFEDIAEELRDVSRRPGQRRSANQHIVIVVQRVDAAAARAVGYVRSTRVVDVRAVTLDQALAAPWKRLAPDIPLTTLPEGSLISAVVRYLRGRRAELGPDDFLTAVIPETLGSDSLFELVRRPIPQRLKAVLVREPGVQVMDAPILKRDIDPNVDEAVEPATNVAVVLVRGMGNATLQAVRYAETLDPTRIVGLNIGLDPEASMRLGNEWMSESIPYPLVIEDSPFRDVGSSIRAYVRELGPDGVEKVVTVVIPELVVPTRRHRILHRQTALVAKRYLLFERGVVVVSVPYHIGRPLPGRAEKVGAAVG